MSPPEPFDAVNIAGRARKSFAYIDWLTGSNLSYISNTAYENNVFTSNSAMENTTGFLAHATLFNEKFLAFLTRHEK